MAILEFRTLSSSLFESYENSFRKPGDAATSSSTITFEVKLTRGGTHQDIDLKPNAKSMAQVELRLTISPLMDGQHETGVGKCRWFEGAVPPSYAGGPISDWIGFIIRIPKEQFDALRSALIGGHVVKTLSVTLDARSFEFVGLDGYAWDTKAIPEVAIEGFTVGLSLPVLPDPLATDVPSETERILRGIKSSVVWLLAIACATLVALLARK
jgi:hypothetical protein